MTSLYLRISSEKRSEHSPVKTTHRLLYGDSARELKHLEKASVRLVVTSPPYPMIEMWDGLFQRLDPVAGEKLERGDGNSAHERMHRVLDRVWGSLEPVVAPGGTVCINIGDATRTVDGIFRLYPNHSMVGRRFLTRGYRALPEIIWRKTSNKPNKFMGSGMLPPGAYVTQEHEYIMTYRKPGTRVFGTDDDRAARRRSGYFWEERNVWFSDIWAGLHGERQSMKGTGPRSRSGSFPFELAHRLVCMYSVMGDMVLDPFAGTGVTTLAAMVAGRNSISIEIERGLKDVVESRLSRAVEFGNDYNEDRLRRHARFAAESPQMRYRNENYTFPVMTRQETALEIPKLASVDKVAEDTFLVEYA